ncbi:VOC family protein [Cellulomonas endometrii]|uniref:VOC family protein n=1 Tax=Cellulomonas endometrii TaxID=3036301 RepID=UPI0024ACEE34|nr:VOC family protein [Cellulomonas endometrii]
MASTFHGLTFDAYDAHAVARFWGAALGRDVAPGASPEHAGLLDDPASGAPRLVFDRVRSGGVVRNALHLDLVTTDLERESERLVRLGARRLGAVGGAARWVSLTDPEGNAFDLIPAA